MELGERSYCSSPESTLKGTTIYFSQEGVDSETNYSTVCIKLSRGGVNRFYAFYPIFRVSQNYVNALKII